MPDSTLIVSLQEMLVAFGAAAAPTEIENPLVLVGVMLGLGATFGFLLAYADKKIAVKLNPLIHVVEEELPKGQCGACGFPGCAKYAEAVVEDPSVKPNLCVPGGDAVAALVAELTGKVMEKTEPRVAVVMCRGDSEIARQRYLYDGIPDCRSANLLFGGGKACEYGCLGFGNCTKVCNFEAISMGPKGLPVVDLSLCVGCGACAEACPRDVIELVPRHAKVLVPCRSHDKAGVVKKACEAGCLGCSLCKKACPHDAIVMDNFLARVNPDICKTCDDPLCLTAKCQPKIIGRVSLDG